MPLGRRLRWYGIGTVLCTAALILPLVLGEGPQPKELPQGEQFVWVANDTQGDIVRINAEIGRIDARLPIGEAAADGIGVSQNVGTVVVQIGDRISRVDLANLAWGTDWVSASGDLFVGEDVVYIVKRDGTVRALDPVTLEQQGDEVDLEATPHRPVVSGDRLVVPTDDGRVTVVDHDEVADRTRVGKAGDDLGVSLVDDEAVVLNLSTGELRRVDVGGKVDVGDPVDFEVPDGPVQLPEEQPGGPLWVAAPLDGQLVGLDLDDGGDRALDVASPGHRLAGPVMARDHVYLVDLDGEQIVDVDTEAGEVTTEPIDIQDPGAIELVVAGEHVVVNDRQTSSATVLTPGADSVSVDKYSDEGVAEPLPEPDLVNQVDPPPAQQEPNQPEAPQGPQPTPPPTTLPPVTLPPTTTTTVPGVDPPGAVRGLDATSGDGQVDLTWSAPRGSVDDYAIEVTPAINGRTSFTTTGTSYSFTSLANGTRYTFTVAARNEGGAGDETSVASTPGRAPSVSGVTANRTADRQFRVTFSYDSGGRPVDDCTVAVGGSTTQATCEGGTGTATGVSVSNYATGYTFTAGVETSLGDASANGSGRSANKPLTVAGDAARFDGSCTWAYGQPNARPYYSVAQHGCPGHDGEPQPGGYIPSGTGVRAVCQTTGESVKDDDLNASTRWVRIEGYGYMNTLWFTTWNSNPEANLPAC